MDSLAIVVVIVIIFTLVYAFIKQIQYTKKIKDTSIHPTIRREVNRKLRIMNIALLGIIVFYSLNVVTGLGILSINNLLSNTTALGAFVSFIIYFLIKMRMSQQNYKL